MAKGRPVTIKNRIIAVSLTLLAAGAFTAFVVQHGSARHPQAYALPATADASDSPEGQVKATVELALRTHQTLSVPPVPAGATPTAADLQAQHDNGVAAINAIFGTSVAVQETKALDKAIALERTGHFKVLGGGVENIKFNSIVVNADNATVTLSVDTWSKISLRNPDGTWHPTTPRNTLNVTMTLSRDFQTGRWTVETFDWSFTPETRP